MVQQELQKRERPISKLAIIEWSEKLHRKHAAVETPRAVLVAGCDIELSRVISSFGLNAVTVCIDNAAS